MKLSTRFIISALLIFTTLSCREHSDVKQANAASDYNDAHPIPSSVDPDLTIVQGYGKISVSNEFTCAVYFGSLQCWGLNSAGQLGNGNNTDQLLPKTIISEKVYDVAAGSAHACAVVDHGLECWGSNGSGQLGDNSQIDNNLPQTIFPANSGVKRIATGNLNTCATVNGSLRCWGDNNSGQIGDGTISALPVLIPQTVIASGVTDVATNGGVTCAVVSGALKCWGTNTFGQLGDGTTTDSYLPKTIIVSGVTKVVISQQANYVCAIVSGALYCWGRNNVGNVGNGVASGVLVKAPVMVIASGVTDVSANGDPCAVVSGVVKCWGAGDHVVAANSPATFQNAIVAKSVSSGRKNSCFISSTDELWCWGYNTVHGTLGYGNATLGFSEFAFQLFISPHF
jgi:alpha-tubulin suppressor-like RCC1 family protein